MCDDERVAGPSKSYRRALAIVVALNLGTGLVEMAAGVLGSSQSLKADSLDFLGDGLITLIGLAAVSRGKRWRARAAFLQGLFLAALALGIVAVAFYRSFMQLLPEWEVMTTFGVIGIVVNVTCALILIPHRHGDAGVRAVWLFSRNDALGNCAVAIAGGLVLWTGSAWPDVVTAVVIAGLFLHSAAEIMTTARKQLG